MRVGSESSLPVQVHGDAHAWSHGNRGTCVICGTEEMVLFRPEESHRKVVRGQAGEAPPARSPQMVCGWEAGIKGAWCR